MATALKSKPGLTGATALSIPATWDATWFRHFIHNMLKGADVRNAVGVGGVTVTGNISSPYSTIGFNGSTGLVITDGTHTVNGVTSIQFSGAVVSGVSPNGVVTISASGGVTSVTGTTNEIVATPTTGAIVLSFAPNVVIPAPASGTPVIINGTTGAGDILTIQATAGVNAGVLGLIDGQTGTRHWQCAVGVAGAGIFSIRDVTAGSLDRLTISTAGNTFISNNGAQFSDGSTYALNVRASANGVRIHAGTGTGDNSFVITDAADAINHFVVNGAGNVSIAAPSSGFTLGVGGSSTMGPGVASADTLLLTGSSTSGQSFGLTIEAGTTTADAALRVNNQANTLNYLVVYGDGGVVVGSPTGGDKGLGTINATGLFVNGVPIGSATTGTFTATLVGLAAGATAPCTWSKSGNSVTLFMGIATSTTGSGSTFSISNLPAAIQPTTAKFVSCSCLGQNNGATSVNVGAFVTGVSLEFLVAGSLTGWISASVRSMGNATGGATFTWETT